MRIFIARTFTLICIFILLGLGVWQLLRMQEKNVFIDMLNHRMNMEIAEVSEMSPDLSYRNIKICGKFLPKNDIFVYANPYYLILAPFQITESNNIIMVARGRMHQQDKISNVNYEITSPDREQCISGMLVNSEKSTPFMPEMDGSHKKPFLSINIDGIRNVVGQNLVDYYLIQTGNGDELGEAKLHPMALKSPDQIYNNHIEYALTWFMLASILFFMFASTFRKKNE